MTNEEETLRYWLSHEDWYPSKYTQIFLKNTLHEEATDTLARIAADAQPEPHSYGALLYTAFATAGFLPSTGGKIPRRKAGVRAALLLASLNDPRSIPPLVRIFELEGVWQNKYQAQIVQSLTKILGQEPLSGEVNEYQASVETLVQRLWNHHPKQKMDDTLNRLLRVALTYLHRINPDLPLLQKILQSETSRYHSSRVQQAVVALLDNAPLPR